MGMACGHLIIHPSVITHLMEGPFMVPFLVQAVVASHGVEVVAGYSVAGEGFVGGSGKEWVAWGNHDGERGSISTTG
jgi:hypothetical protein